MKRRFLTILVLALSLLIGPAPVSAARVAGGGDFSGWHLPLPAGEWRISRGPCGSAARFNHDCRYYEEKCAVDLTPLSGSMENVPVLAPQAGQVFFLGTRVDAGLMVMLRHADGRVSTFLHLSKVVVGLDETVTQGQVVGYAGSTGSSGNPHLHFFVQPNAVERECVELQGLDDLNYRTMTATSRNLAWAGLTLPDPPAALPGWLATPSTARPAGDVVLPAKVLLAPGAGIRLPVALTGALTTTAGLLADGTWVTPTLRTSTYALFDAPLTAPQQVGTYAQTWQLRAAGGASGGKTITLSYSVRLPPDTRPSQGLVQISPNFVGPNGWASLRQPPRLCWTEARSAGQPPFQFRVMIVGAASADSGWMPDTCWQAPRLKPGTYFWKVFVRDAQGRMNRTNQRPYAFIISGR